MYVDNPDMLYASVSIQYVQYDYLHNAPDSKKVVGFYMHAQYLS